MADETQKGEPEAAASAKQPSRKQRTVSDEIVDQVKTEILFGTGYKRPPEGTRFRKGQSGNPRGRPKTANLGPEGSRSANVLALRQAAQLITIREGGETKQIPAIDAVFRSQYVSATKGSAYSQKHIIERYDRAERERRRQVSEENEIWRGYIAEWSAAIAEAEHKGEAPPAPLPHPDDVVIDDESGVRFVGPVVEEQVHQLEETCRMRDMLIQQDALDSRQVDEPESDNALDKPGTALLWAIILNQSVPDRFKLSDNGITIRMLRYDHIPKRQLLKKVCRGWRSLGIHPPRGKAFPPLRIGKETVALLYNLLQRSRDGRLDIANSTLEELVAEITAVMLERQQAET